MIIPCSKRKSAYVDETVAAIKLYDGPFFRIIRKTFKELGRLHSLDIRIVSAKYGLIDQEDMITMYDQRMTPDIAENISGTVYRKLVELFNKNQYEEILVNLGKTYLIALRKSRGILMDKRVKYVHGGIGERNRQLKNWLLAIYGNNKGIST